MSIAITYIDNLFKQNLLFDYENQNYYNKDNVIKPIEYSKTNFIINFITCICLIFKTYDKKINQTKLNFNIFKKNLSPILMIGNNQKYNYNKKSLYIENLLLSVKNSKIWNILKNLQYNNNVNIFSYDPGIGNKHKFFYLLIKLKNFLFHSFIFNINKFTTPHIHCNSFLFNYCNNININNIVLMTNIVY